MDIHVKPIGFGADNSHIKIYIANRPSLDDYPFMDQLRGLSTGEISHIVKNTSNHWRKVFNVYAKFLFDWYGQEKREDLPTSWQAYRDSELFQYHSREALFFSKPQFSGSKAIHIVAGKTYAASLALPSLTWIDNYFALNEEHRLIVSPYPDYRQLSNERINRMIMLMKSFK